MAITFNNTTYPPGFQGIDDGGASAAFNIDVASTYTTRLNGTVSKAGDTVQMTYGADAPAGYANTSVTLTATQFDNANQILFTAPTNTALPNSNVPPGQSTGDSSYRYVFSNTQVYGTNPPVGQTRTRFTADADGQPASYNVAAAPCFATGTLILTAKGEVAVEDLQVGDLAVTTSGAQRPIRWIGHQTAKTRNMRNANDLMPVRLVAGALGENRPARDLVVSPGHAICLDVLGEVLIPASALVNGTTITQQDVETVTYWHVELDSHDILIAEGQPAESYLEMGNRGFFVESGVVDLGATPDADAAARTHADFCRPYHADGVVLDAVRAQVQARAEQRGWRLDDATWADMHLMVDGVRVEADTHGLSAHFVLPASAQDVWLVSETSVPREVGFGADARRLGLCLQGITIDDGVGEKRSVALDDPRLSRGFHDCEEGVRRWTTGWSQLPAALFDGCRGTVFLRLDLAGPALPRWVAPEAATVNASLPEAPRLSLVA